MNTRLNNIQTLIKAQHKHYKVAYKQLHEAMSYANINHLEPSNEVIRTLNYFNTAIEPLTFLTNLLKAYHPQIFSVNESMSDTLDYLDNITDKPNIKSYIRRLKVEMS